MFPQYMTDSVVGTHVQTVLVPVVFPDVQQIHPGAVRQVNAGVFTQEQRRPEAAHQRDTLQQTTGPVTAGSPQYQGRTAPD